ncbi:class I SAM-dependent methyltransferase [Aestuariibius sp. HNIBRBA575]|uniref:class I SAM-dependent DNA methyltransferase n=1 Tax=Aestuariibius sp. HNIBRBA575 TaxID=3233343 RepID=UPI0034A149CF
MRYTPHNRWGQKPKGANRLENACICFAGISPLAVHAQTGPDTPMKPDDILPTYNRVAPEWDRRRDRSLFERKWMDRLIQHTPLNEKRRRVLDLGCGSGRPIASYLLERGLDVTGVDGAAAMVELFKQNLPRAKIVNADMRGLDLGQKFDAVMGWNSFFHLSAEDQRAMFAVFARHAAPRAALMFTSGTSNGEAIGHVADEPVYHASLDPQEYRDLLTQHGFEELAFVPEDPECNQHTIWLARYVGLG